MKVTETAAEMADSLNAQAQALRAYRAAYLGETGPVYMSRESRKALNTGLASLGVNYARMYVKALADRLTLAGFRRQGSTELDEDMWAAYRAAGLKAGAEITHTDYLTYGEAYLTVWAADGAPDRPVVMYDSPLTAYVDTDAATGTATRALRVWHHNGKRRALLVEPDRMTRLEAGEGPLTAPGTWTVAPDGVTDNPWHEIPLVRFARRLNADDPRGESALADIVGLNAAHSKVLQDAIVSSETYARPRRWVTGLEIEYDDDGNPIDPFGESRLLQSESPETRFGQFEASRLDGYASLLDTLTASIAASTGLPPHYLGIHADQPANAESIRASEAQLVAQAYTEQNRLETAWADVGAWLVTIQQGLAERPRGVVPRWDDAETRTPAQAADGAAKLASIGVPLRALLDNPLRLEPHEIAAIMEEREQEALLQAAYTLGGTS